MAGTRIISVIGKKNAGKTTLVVALAQEFVRRGKRVGTIKHGHHPALVDREGKDTWRHYFEGKAAKTLIESPGQRVLFERVGEEPADPVDLVRAHFADTEIVIVEGFKRARLPKIEVHRMTEHTAPLYDPSQPEANEWVAMLTDDRALRLPFPVFNFTDTAWFTSLAALAWTRAFEVDG